MTAINGWLKPILTPLIVAGLLGLVSFATTYGIMGKRIDDLEKTVSASLNQEAFKKQGAFEQRLNAIENRVNDTSLIDWTSWRATVDQRLDENDADRERWRERRRNNRTREFSLPQ